MVSEIVEVEVKRLPGITGAWNSFCIHPDGSIAFLYDDNTNSIFKINMNTGEKTFITRDSGPVYDLIAITRTSDSESKLFIIAMTKNGETDKKLLSFYLHNNILTIADEFIPRIDTEFQAQTYFHKDEKGRIFLLSFDRNTRILHETRFFYAEKIEVDNNGKISTLLLASKMAIKGSWLFPFVNSNFWYFIPSQNKDKTKLLKVSLSNKASSEVYVQNYCDIWNISTSTTSVLQYINGDVLFFDDKNVENLLLFEFETRIWRRISINMKEHIFDIDFVSRLAADENGDLYLHGQCRNDTCEDKAHFFIIKYNGQLVSNGDNQPVPSSSKNTVNETKIEKECNETTSVTCTLKLTDYIKNQRRRLKTKEIKQIAGSKALQRERPLPPQRPSPPSPWQLPSPPPSPPQQQPPVPPHGAGGWVGNRFGSNLRVHPDGSIIILFDEKNNPLIHVNLAARQEKGKTDSENIFDLTTFVAQSSKVIILVLEYSKKREPSKLLLTSLHYNNDSLAVIDEHWMHRTDSEFWTADTYFNKDEKGRCYIMSCDRKDTTFFNATKVDIDDTGKIKTTSIFSSILTIHGDWLLPFINSECVCFASKQDKRKLKLIKIPLSNRMFTAVRIQNAVRDWPNAGLSSSIPQVIGSTVFYFVDNRVEYKMVLDLKALCWRNIIDGINNPFENCKLLRLAVHDKACLIYYDCHKTVSEPLESQLREALNLRPERDNNIPSDSNSDVTTPTSRPPIYGPEYEI